MHASTLRDPVPREPEPMKDMRRRRARERAAIPRPLRTIAAVALLLLPLAATPRAATAQEQSDIHLLGLEHSGDRLVLVQAARAVTDRTGYDNQPAFTPDGRALLYTSIRDGQADTYRYDLATGATVRVTRTSRESEYSPTPIPGMDRFSVVRVEADSAQRLWSFAADGTDPQLLLERVDSVGYNAWLTPERVALYILGEPATLQIVGLDSGEERVVAERIGRSIQPVPARSAVSFTQESGGRWWLRELDMDSGRLRTLAPLLGEDEYHAWTPDGTVITAHGTRIFQLEAATRSWRPVGDLARFGLRDISRLAVSPDGRQLAVVAARPEAPTVGGGHVATGDGTIFAFATVVFGSLLAMVNPLGALTIFVGLTSGQARGQRGRTALLACVSAAAILLVFALFGTAILRFFGITTYAFRIAGGILFFGIGWDMLQARRSRSKTTAEEEAESAERADVAVVPLGIPTLAGPGAITTVIALMGQTTSPLHAGIVYAGIAAVLLVSLVVLLAGPGLFRLLGQTGINVVTRLMGLLVMVVGVQFVLDGLRTVVMEILTAV